MFGKIIDVDKNKIMLENITNEIPLQYVGIHVIFEEVERKIVGKISKVLKDFFEIELLGEISNNNFIAGIYKSPELKQSPRIISSNELELLIGKQDYTKADTFLLGSSTVYKNFKVTSDLNRFFSNHFAIIGNSGAGKSCGVASILQNIFYYNKDKSPVNCHIALFDIYGEYNHAFTKINDIPNINYKSLVAQPDETNAEVITLPPYFLDADDLAILLSVEDSSLIPILEKAIQYANIFKSNDPNISKYKNEIISNCLLEVLSSGKNAPQIRDQIISILTKYQTKELNLDSEIKEPGYTRTLKQCLNIDNQGKINAISQVIDYLNQFKSEEAKYITAMSTYNLQDLYDSLDFALLSEGAYNNQAIYEKASNLKVKLHQIIYGPYHIFFEYPNAISKKEYVEQFFKNPNGEEVQIVDINLSSVDDRFAKMLTKIYSRLFFLYGTNNPTRASYPIHIILEEAHRYVNNDHDIDILGYNIFDRITKEGRKYGIIMGFITQRPSELSETALSQCSNFLVFRIFHPDDFRIVNLITSGISKEELEQIKSLRSGVALAFGNALALPTIVQLDMPNPTPLSSNVNIKDVWF